MIYLFLDYPLLIKLMFKQNIKNAVVYFHRGDSDKVNEYSCNCLGFSDQNLELFVSQ